MLEKLHEMKMASTSRVEDIINTINKYMREYDEYINLEQSVHDINFDKT